MCIRGLSKSEGSFWTFLPNPLYPTLRGRPFFLRGKRTPTYFPGSIPCLDISWEFMAKGHEFMKLCDTRFEGGVSIADDTL